VTESGERGRRRRQAAACLAIAVIGAALAMAMPTQATAANKLAWPTTTKKTTTTSTTMPVTTTSLDLPPDECGSRIRKADGTLWECTFIEDFDGDTLDRSTWIPQQTANSSFTSGVECNMDSPDNVSVGGGVLRLTARKEAAPFTCQDPKGNFTTQYTAGSVSTYQRWSQAYGRFEVRAKFPGTAIKGLQSALWMWPDNDTKYGAWPKSGEIDIAEEYSLNSDRVIPYIHYVPWGGDAKATNNYCLVADVSQFHTYVVEWTTKTISIIYDNRVCTVDNWNPALPLTKPAPFDQPFMVALTQALGIGKNAFDPATTPLPATTEVDYVHVWK
jgi:beta-glucanase (GH16 family)